MKMNMRILIATGMLTTRAFASDDICEDNDRPFAICCPTVSPYRHTGCVDVPDPGNITQFEETCQAYGQVPLCCASASLVFISDCAPPVENNE